MRQNVKKRRKYRLLTSARTWYGTRQLCNAHCYEPVIDARREELVYDTRGTAVRDGNSDGASEGDPCIIYGRRISELCSIRNKTRR
jgi:hypothetical protein